MSCKLVHVLSYCGVSIAYNKRRYDDHVVPGSCWSSCEIHEYNMYCWI